MPTLRINNENENSLHFITITIIEWIDIFTKKEYFDILINSLIFCQEKLGLLLYEYVFMTNHIHIIVSVKEGFKLSKTIGSFKQFTTKEIINLLQKDNREYILKLIENSIYKKLGNDFQIWQRENEPKLIETEKFLQQKIDYIYNNPVIKGYVASPEDWLYSSARNRMLEDSCIVELADWE